MEKRHNEKNREKERKQGKKEGRKKEKEELTAATLAPKALCSLIKPGVARLGGVCAVAGGVRVAPRGRS